MKRFTLFFCGMIAGFSLQAQDRYFTKTGHIDFFSSTPIEDIKAANDQVTSFLDVRTGEMVFSVLMRSFSFDKALMQEHFNENYVESDKFPKASFVGKILGLGKIQWDKPGAVTVTVKGKLTLHGVLREIEEIGTLTIEAGKISGKSVFKLKPEDYGIMIPQVVRKNIAEQMTITVMMHYLPYKK